MIRYPAPIVFLVDDDDAVRRALARLIRSAGYQVEAFASARAFLEHQWAAAGPACLVLDVRLPDRSGLELQRELNRASRILPIIFISGHGDIPMTVTAMKAGAADFLPKPIQDVDLLGAIEQAIDRASRAQVLQLELDAIQSRFDHLTPREREVMALVVTGLLNKQVARELGTVEKTIKVHRARVMEKMGVHSLAELVRVAEKTLPGRLDDRHAAR
jgi:FixJ family two-component response regulator